MAGSIMDRIDLRESIALVTVIAFFLALLEVPEHDAADDAFMHGKLQQLMHGPVM